MPSSPALDSDGVLLVSIASEGTTLPGTYEIVSVEIETRLNRIGSATIVFNDGDMPNADFPLSSSDLLTPGKTLTISVGYGDTQNTLYTGVIVKHAIRIGAGNASRLVIECKDKALAMTVGRKNACYVDMTDSDIITSLAGNCSGLSATVDATTITYPELVQYHCSDWDFLLARAEANGM
ncbi:MAG: Rhs element Vgr protein, partial [Pseudomonadota bacterium]|nr:Rhs element Vgr protein [Pseudomonadota bacterium]